MKWKLENHADCGNDSISHVTNCASSYDYLDLKAEIEKLRAAQRGRQNVNPERYRLCQQEITSLRMKLHQQERDMAEMQRSGAMGRVPRDPGGGWAGPGTLLCPSRPPGLQQPPGPSQLFPSGFIILTRYLLIINPKYMCIFYCFVCLWKECGKKNLNKLKKENTMK